MPVWWMFDNHTFRRVQSEQHAIELFDMDPWGSLFVRDDQDRSLPLEIHGHGTAKSGEFLDELDRLWPEIEKHL